MRLMIRPVAVALALGLVASVPLAPAPLEARPAPESFADLAERLLPSVVNISTTQTVAPRRDRQGPEIPQFPPGSPFEEFFREFFDRQQRGQGPQAPLPPRRAQSLGSGFVIAYQNGEGLIVTNNHVIDGADEINAILTDNTTLKAEVVGRDQRTDLALLRVKSDKPLTPVTFGDSASLRIGDWVLAIGNPFGLGGSVTAGIVSARGRDIRIGPYDDFIQTDAAINRGNSGGPLFNMAGEVVGINTAIFSPTGGSIGIGFAIPSNLATNVIAQLREYGRARRGWLGVRIQQVTDEIAESVGLAGGARGALVAGVNDGGPAAKADIQNGDIILEFNGQEIREMRILPRVVAETRIGSQVPVVVWRNGRRVTLTVTVGELPEGIEQASATPGPQDPGGRPAEIAGTGLKLSALTPELRERFSVGADVKGVLVVEVEPGSPAAERGIRPGDVIVEVQQEPVSTPAEVQERVNRVRQAGRQNVLLLIDGQQGMRYVPVPAGRG
jgi:serine protease Do